MKRVFGMLNIVLLILVPFTASASLVAHYQLDGNANDETGIYNGSPTDVTWTSDRFGNPNSAALFNDSSSYIDTLPVGDIPSTITFAAWILPTDSTGQIWGSISSATSGKDGYLGNFGPDSVRFHYAKNNINMGIGIDYTPAGSVPLNEWTHVAFTLDGAGKAGIYVNGAPMVAFEISTTADAHDRALMIGKSVVAQSRSWGGSIDDVRIYDNALTASEVSALLPNVPIPGAIWLLGSAFIGLVGFRRKFIKS